MEMQKSFSELIDHFRSKAKQYNETADSLEREAWELGYVVASEAVPEHSAEAGFFSSVRSPSATDVGKVSRGPRSFGLPAGEATAEKIKAYLKIKKARIKDLALHFRVSEHVIREIVNTRSNGVMIGDRGWLHSVKQHALALNHQEEEHAAIS